MQTTAEVSVVQLVKCPLPPTLTCSSATSSTTVILSVLKDARASNLPKTAYKRSPIESPLLSSNIPETRSVFDEGEGREDAFGTITNCPYSSVLSGLLGESVCQTTWPLTRSERRWIDLTGRIRLTLSDQNHLAVGGFGQILRAEWIRNDRSERTEVALKILHTRGYEGARRVIDVFEREFRVWKRLSHPNVAPLFGICSTRSLLGKLVGPCGVPALVSPFYNNGNAVDYLRLYPQSDRLNMIVDIATGLTYLHEQGIIHGDLKAMNVLVDDDGTAVIADFGLSRIISERGFTTDNIGGSVRWMAPELLIPPKDADGTEELGVTYASDVWAFAMTVIEIYTGEVPFNHLRQDAWVITDILMNGGRPMRPFNPEVPISVWNLLQRCWALAPQHRPGIAEACSTLMKTRMLDCLPP